MRKIKKNRTEVLWVKGGVLLMFGAVNEVRDVYFFYYEGVMIAMCHIHYWGNMQQGHF